MPEHQCVQVQGKQTEGNLSVSETLCETPLKNNSVSSDTFIVEEPRSEEYEESIRNKLGLSYAKLRLSYQAQ